MIRLAAIAALAALALPTSASARAVALTDATAAPSYVRVLAPGASVTKTRQCPRGARWSDVNAYRGNGRALASQRRSAWGRVTFEGVTFRNAERFAVLVAGWCE